MSNTLWILRGVSGSGKTTLAKELERNLNAVICAADDYHYDEKGNYNFNINNLGKAHKNCREKVESAMQVLSRNIVVHNTNTTEKEVKSYTDLADKYGYKIVSLVVENRHGNNNVHNVPEDVLLKQEYNLKNNMKLR